MAVVESTQHSMAIIEWVVLIWTPLKTDNSDRYTYRTVELLHGCCLPLSTESRIFIRDSVLVRWGLHAIARESAISPCRWEKLDGVFARPGLNIFLAKLETLDSSHEFVF